MIAEAYHTIQGEGLRAGRPSLLVRLNECNLDCRWCDTKDHLKTLEEPIPHKEVESLMREFKNSDLIITGGEPLLNQEEVRTLIMMWIGINGRRHPTITIETNGTFTPTSRIGHFSNILWSVSPKLPSSGETYNIKNIEFFSSSKLNSQFKFVVDTQNPHPDLEVLEDIVEHISKDVPIFIQPVSYLKMKSHEYGIEYGNLVEHILDMNIDRDVRIVPQLHKVAWGCGAQKV